LNPCDDTECIKIKLQLRGDLIVVEKSVEKKNEDETIEFEYASV
jgi:hypothetical protein